MSECVIVVCQDAIEIEQARAYWTGEPGLTLLSCNPVTKFGKVRVYDFDAAAPVMPFRDRDRYVLYFTD